MIELTRRELARDHDLDLRCHSASFAPGVSAASRDCEGGPFMSKTCSVDGCARAQRTRGWCNTHYERWRLGRDVEYSGDLRRRDKQEACSLDGCARPHASRGWCEMHYQRWKRNGDPESIQRDYGSYRIVKPNGYVYIWSPSHPLAHDDGYVAEHRMVMSDAGLLSDPSLHVHHKNHIKTDNNLDNLEAVDAVLHARIHALEDGYIVNQYGRFPLRNTLPTPALRSNSCEHEDSTTSAAGSRGRCVG